jgi:two-component system, chemotaxis family, CheB/CheR fusion protein
MTLAVRPRPFLVATVYFASSDLASVRALLEAIAPDQGVSFLLAEGESPPGADRRDLRDRAIGGSRLRSVTATTTTLIEPSMVYFAPRDRMEAVLDGELRLGSDSLATAANGADDQTGFLASLADDQARRACVIVFAGARERVILDDAALLRVAEAGGLVLIQDVAGRSFRRIQYTAERSDPVVTLVDPACCGEVLLDHAEPFIAESRPHTTSVAYRDVERILPEICDAVLAATGHEFHRYKPGSLVRRTLKRLHQAHGTSADAYLRRLRGDSVEGTRLFDELLISVTSFFRDPEAFAALSARVIPRLFESREPGEKVRIWVAGCASGEEAYSIAMLLQEYRERHDDQRPIQIFATDLHESALAVARRGVYAADKLSNVSPERLSRFFTGAGATYQVTKGLRELVIFSRHSVTRDAPFSNLDLVSCRNLLIYLGEELQELVTPLFHHALRPGGSLFLGASESLPASHEYFEAVDLKHRIYVRGTSASRIRPAAPASRFVAHYRRQSARPATASPIESDVLRTMQQTIAEEFTPKGIVVTEAGCIVAASGDVGQYLAPSEGTAVDIVQLAPPGMRTALRETLHAAVSRRTRVAHHGASLRTIEGIQRVTITVQPLAQSKTPGLFLVVFQQVGDPVRE